MRGLSPPILPSFKPGLLKIYFLPSSLHELVIPSTLKECELSRADNFQQAPLSAHVPFP